MKVYRKYSKHKPLQTSSVNNDNQVWENRSHLKKSIQSRRKLYNSVAVGVWSSTGYEVGRSNRELASNN